MRSRSRSNDASALSRVAVVALFVIAVGRWGPSAAQDKAAPAPVKVETGAPRPPVQSLGVDAPPPRPASAPPEPPTVKVGGGLILLYMHPHGLAEDARRLGTPTRKPLMEVFRANILLDSKVDRFGMHLDFRVRDKRVRSFFEGTSWLEEAYASVDLLKADSPLGPLTLKVGKTYAQLGRFFDMQFYGSLALRDGLKLDSNYGASLEGILGYGKLLGARYYGQYFAIDGATNTAIESRDTASNPAPDSGFPGNLARKRNIIVGRIEPFVQLSKTTSFKVGASLQNFTSDWGPTRDQSNVLRYGADVTAEVAWFGAWGEYIEQHGHSTLNSPFPAAAAIDAATDPYGRPSRGASPARASDHVRYFLAGGRFAYKNVMLRYHYSAALFDDVTVPIADIPGVRMPTVQVREKIHTPGVTISITPQLSLWIEHPIWKRHMDGATLNLPAASGGRRAIPAQDWLLDQQFVVTLHGVM